MNSDLQELQDVPVSGLGGDPLQPAPGCSRENQCYDNVCLNGATCRSDWDSYSCECTEDFMGSLCGEGNENNV